VCVLSRNIEVASVIKVVRHLGGGHHLGRTRRYSNAPMGRVLLLRLFGKYFVQRRLK
jgi:hypothetical protein